MMKKPASPFLLIAIGQPHRVRALRDLINYAASHPNVWFASREAIASWYLEDHESHIPGSTVKAPR